MAWKSGTFRKPKGATDEVQSAAISRAVEKHKGAMEDIVRKAREFAADRKRTLDKIQDPDLKRSATR